jgi:D-xylose transport system ATP-binding protein
LLVLSDVKKRFGGVVALDGVSFELRPGEIHALCGENGAGKSTLIKILSGVYPAGSFEGEYLLEGKTARFSSYADAAAAGIAVIYQELALCDELSVAENIFLGHEPRTSPLGLFIDDARMQREAAELLARFGIDLDPRARVGRLGVGQKQLVEIGKALGRRSRVLILDEPTAALSERETSALLSLLRDLRSRGTSIVYISHKLEEVFAIADRITVLRDGRSIFTRPAAELDATAVIRGMCGRSVAELFPSRHGATAGAAPAQIALHTGPRPLLSVKDLTVSATHASAPRLQGISLTVRPGEVVGIGGLLGAGRTELLLHLFGAWGVRRGGSVELDGKSFAPRGPADALSSGVALLSEERRRYGLCMDETVGFNMSLSSLAEVLRPGPLGLIDGWRETRRSLQMAERVRLRSAAGKDTLRMLARALSGGNQQKVVLGKVLLTRPRLLLLDEPTRGIDIGAKQEIYELVHGLCEQGMGVLMVSSELPELLGLSDRILMLRGGALAGEFVPQKASAEHLLAAALGEKAAAPAAEVSR